jgi:mono/diheme cytochrome c family protein
MNSRENDQSFLAGVMWLPLMVTIILAIGLLSLTGAAESRGEAGRIEGTADKESSPRPASPQFAQSAEEGQTLFQQQCTACHTIGGGKLVGPDLLGVTQRRDREWLRQWILVPDKMLAEGDPIATQLLQEYNNVPMPDLGLTDQQGEAIIAYLKTVEGTAVAVPTGLPALYVPTLVASVVALLALTALGLTIGRKRVEVRV